MRSLKSIFAGGLSTPVRFLRTGYEGLSFVNGRWPLSPLECAFHDAGQSAMHFRIAACLLWRGLLSLGGCLKNSASGVRSHLANQSTQLQGQCAFPDAIAGTTEAQQFRQPAAPISAPPTLSDPPSK